MRPPIDATHAAGVTSWVESAQRPETDFPLQNLPFGIFRARDGEPPRAGVAIGDFVLDLPACGAAGLLGNGLEAALRACSAPALNALMALGRPHWAALRRRVHGLLRIDAPQAVRQAVASRLLPRAEAEMFLPAAVGDYTDFYASCYHATHVGAIFRPENPLLPNYKHLPIGYHGRASSLVVSGAAVRRPMGQTHDDPAAPPCFGASRRVDYELEVGCFVGPGNGLGEAVPIVEAEDHLFGLCLVNDWSARDIQAWEYQPLGPFLAKSFATTVSPWVVTFEALAPFRVPALARPGGDPAPLPYLSDASDRQHGGIDLSLEVLLLTPALRQAGAEPVRLSRGNFCDLYWTLAQMTAHHTSNGCNLRPGDLLASGTISGAAPDSLGCLLELTAGGKTPVRLPNGETRRFLEDGDEVIFRAYCARPGFVRIGFGECRGVLQAAHASK